MISTSWTVHSRPGLCLHANSIGFGCSPLLRECDRSTRLSRVSARLTFSHMLHDGHRIRPRSCLNGGHGVTCRHLRRHTDSTRVHVSHHLHLTSQEVRAGSSRVTTRGAISRAPLGATIRGPTSRAPLGATSSDPLRSTSRAPSPASSLVDHTVCRFVLLHYHVLKLFTK